MKFRKLLFVFSSILLGFGCTGHRSDEKEALIQKPVPYTVVQRSRLFNEKNVVFTLDSAGNTLYINLAFSEMKHFPFPVSKKYHDTLFKTAFNFSLLVNGKVIQSEYNKLRFQGWSNDSIAMLPDLVFESDTTDLSYPNTISLEIPMYAFHQLKKGKQAIELKIWQTVFTDEARVENPDSTADYVHVYETRPLLNATVKFDINVPPIYKDIVYGYGLELKNDSTFSPAGMDNTIWKSSYPDIYWKIFYPSNSPYTKTNYETSTDKYVGKDTFNVYHYYADDSIGIGVYDHDNLSRDDGMGFWVGGLEKLERTPVSRITFGYIKSFDMKVEKKGIVN